MINDLITDNCSSLCVNTCPHIARSSETLPLDVTALLPSLIMIQTLFALSWFFASDISESANRLPLQSPALYIYSSIRNNVVATVSPAPEYNLCAAKFLPNTFSPIDVAPCPAA